MRILHTSDWHVGKTLRGRSRAAEHEAALAEIAGVAERERVDLVLVVGDLFDTAAPTAESERIVYRALLDLAATGAPVVVVAGNHDNERRLQAVEPLLGLGRIITRASFAGPAEGGVASIETALGERAQVAMLPFLSQRGIVKADELMASEAADHAQHYESRARRLIDALAGEFRAETVNLVAAHLMVLGGQLGGGERTAHTVFDYSVPASAMPAGAHYVALGHLHQPQRIAAPCPTWYCGSPLHLDFGEKKGQKGVLVVDVSARRPAEVRVVELRSGRKLQTLRGSLSDLRVLAGSTGDDYLRVVVYEQARVGLGDEVRDLFPEAVDVIVEAPSGAGTVERPRRSGRAAHELFAEYLTEKNAEDERVAALFSELWDEEHAAAPA